mmetsp:Transcript_21629/g.21379  ORF Transcript_21629/g.21379 Transcript_21629/m.21379 type:complete len:179 (-) Transcript_21629:45-581(-)
MSSIYNWNVPITVPPVHDTTPCMDYMIAYEECLVDAVPRNMEVFHPNWPTMWPRLLTDGKLRPDLLDDETAEIGPVMDRAFTWMKPLSESVKEKLWECEEERFLYKGCLRKLLSRKNDPRTRYPFWQPEEHSTKALGRRLYVDPRNRYPSDMNHDVKESDQDYVRRRWAKFVEEGGDL